MRRSTCAPMTVQARPLRDARRLGFTPIHDGPRELSQFAVGVGLGATRAALAQLRRLRTACVSSAVLDSAILGPCGRRSRMCETPRTAEDHSMLKVEHSISVASAGEP